VLIQYLERLPLALVIPFRMHEDGLAHSLVFLPLLAETFGVLVRIPERRHTIIDFAALPGTTTWRSLLAHHLAYHSDRRSDVAP
jgi:hypothetical protein